MPVHIANHPIVAAKLTALRNRDTKPVDFRRILKGKKKGTQDIFYVFQTMLLA